MQAGGARGVKAVSRRRAQWAWLDCWIAVIALVAYESGFFSSPELKGNGNTSNALQTLPKDRATALGAHPDPLTVVAPDDFNRKWCESVVNHTKWAKKNRLASPGYLNTARQQFRFGNCQQYGLKSP